MKVNAPIVVDDYCEKKVCQVNIGPVGIQNCVITDTKICAGGVPDPEVHVVVTQGEPWSPRTTIC